MNDANTQSAETGGKTEKPDFSGDEIHLPAVIGRNEAKVASGFWSKASRVAASIPFADDLLAAYYCTRDPDTPLRVRAVLLAALAYFVVPTDIIPDFIAGLGYGDDASVLMGALAMISQHIKPEHREKAERTVERMRNGESVADDTERHEAAHG